MLKVIRRSRINECFFNRLYFCSLFFVDRFPNRVYAVVFSLFHSFSFVHSKDNITSFEVFLASYGARI